MHSNKLFLFIILLMGCLSQVASDIYTPSVPAIAQAFAVHLNQVQWSMATYMFGLALSLLIYGPLSEGFGRRKILIIGLSIFIFGTLASLLAQDMPQLILGRLFQGIGAGAAACLWRSIFRDVYSGAQLAKYASYLTMIVAFVIPAAPALGGYLQHYLDWRASFGFILAYALISLIIVWFFLKETLQSKTPFMLTQVLPTYFGLLKNRAFFGTTIAMFLTYGSYFAWFVASPALLIHKIGISPIAYGWFTFGIGGIAYLIGGRLNAVLVTRFDMPCMLRMGWSLILLAGCMIIASQFFIGLNFWILGCVAFFFFLGTTFIWPNTFSTAFSAVRDKFGYASAAYSCMQMLGGAALGGLISHLPATSSYPLGMVFISAPLLAWLTYEFMVRPVIRT